jgi:hypothetical protein
MHRAARQAHGRAVLPKEEGLDGGVIGQHGDQDFRTGGGLTRRRGHARAPVLERLGGGAGAVVDRQVVPRAAQVLRHCGTHAAEAKECDVHSYSSVVDGCRARKLAK